MNFIGLSETVSFALSLIAFVIVYYIFNISRWRIRALDMPMPLTEPRHREQHPTFVRQH